MVILEVGLGGRLDATNIVDADVAVVTSIALDHTDWLGPDRESIGREKAGIFRAGKAAIVGEPDMPLTIAQVADEKGRGSCAVTLTGGTRPGNKAGLSTIGRGVDRPAAAAGSDAECGYGDCGLARQRA